MTAMYHTIHYIASGSFKCEDPVDMLDVFKKVFNLSETEKSRFSVYADIFWQCESQFEVEFSKYAAKMIFGRSRVSPSTLAYVNYYFCRSYNQFIAVNQNYVA
jgi:hypothetical protein